MRKLFFLTLVALLTLSTPLFAQTAVEFLPKESEFVLKVNVKKIFDIPNTREKLLSETQKPTNKKGFDEFVDKTGLDPFKDIDSITLFVTGPFDLEKPSGAAILKGKFKTEKFKESILKDPKTAKEVKLSDTKDGFYSIVPNDPEDKFCGAFNKHLVIAGTEKEVDSVKKIYNKKGGALAPANALYGLARSFNSDAVISAAGTLNQNLKQTIAASEQLAPISYLDSFSFEIMFTKNLTLELSGTVDKKENLEEVQVLFNGYLAALKTVAANAGPNSPQSKEMEALKSIVENISVNAKDKTIRIKAVISEAVMKTISEAATPATKQGK